MAATMEMDIGYSDDAVVEISFRIFDPEGIESITVEDGMGFTFDFEPPREGCPERHRIDLGRVPRTRLPLTVTVESCSDGRPATVFQDVGAPGGGPIDGPDFRLPCYATNCMVTSACSEATGRLRTLRNRFELLCQNRGRNERIVREMLALMAATLLIIALGFVGIGVAAGVPFGWILILFLLAVIAVAAYSYLRYSQQKLEADDNLARINQSIRELRPEFEAAAEVVTRECCENCIDVSTNPPC